MANSKSEIKFVVELDENNIPQDIEWHADGTGDKGMSDSIMLALWDAKDKNTLRIDLWTKHMMVEDMRLFLYQSLLSMADSFERATGDNDVAADLRHYSQLLGQKMDIVKPKE